MASSTNSLRFAVVESVVIQWPQRMAAKLAFTLRHDEVSSHDPARASGDNIMAPTINGRRRS
jgi:hypothetical protein